MWFDAKAKLAEIEAGPPVKVANPAKPHACAPAEFSSLAGLAEAHRLNRASNRGPGTKRGNRALPNAPPTCALCGISDWTVSLTDMRGDTFHVACWQERHPYGCPKQN